ncbi:MAG: hypothetical protein WBF43_12095 [Methylocella sp.]
MPELLVAASLERRKAGEPCRFQRRCAACVHPERAIIEQDIARGVSQRSLTKKYDFSCGSLSRHWSMHVSKKAKAALVAGPARRAKLLAAADETQLNTLEYFRAIRSRLFDPFIVCSDANDHDATAIIAGRLLQALNDLGRASGELMVLVDGTTINLDMRTQIMSSPVVAEIEAGLIRTLAPFPEARAAVIAMLQAIDRRDAATMKTIEPPVIAAGVADAA